MQCNHLEQQKCYDIALYFLFVLLTCRKAKKVLCIEQPLLKPAFGVTNIMLSDNFFIETMYDCNFELLVETTKQRKVSFPRI